MKFLQVLDGAEVLSTGGNPDAVNPEISGVEYDSRRVQPGNLFVAMKGESTDGNRYITKAIENGAVAVVSDSTDETGAFATGAKGAGTDGAPIARVAWARVPHGRRALARVSANFYGRPAEKLANTGVTGTNGKTTTTFLIEAILNKHRERTVLVGTIEYHVLGKVIPAPHTTPESLELNRMFAEALANGATETVMEVSSHALEQQRVYGIPYDVAVFTNLTRDHLDYHKTMESYFASKKILFEGCGTDRPRVAVINIDDEYGRELVKFSKKKGSEVVTYGLDSGDFHATKVDIGLKGTRFDMVTPSGALPMWSPLIGRVNVYNILAASAAAWARGCDSELITTGVAALENVPGRFQPIQCGQPFTVVVDYAHTDDALKNLTSLAREFVSKSGGKVITIFGCGGDRDRAKRPLMGEAAGRGSDFVIVTSDNPRSEDPLAIIEDAKPGVKKTGTEFLVEPDRRKAIDVALHRAQPGDIVLIAGKGHEKTQTTREGVAPFDDAEVARELMHEMGYTKNLAGQRA
ncbi:MAG TPA: UDP-N-acetylmuramoyl-L-alanyl-D-glutamate--2,6-diaminopimelate ligase [Terriglobales bacterium]|nr:UDP-N-acetylmuramoyl-L-alanyl-D-glutamate--2,6-diaminopimelate ligase [Terriglobales bacterium]